MTGCVCVSQHRPPPLELHEHHLWPVYLHGPPHPATMLLICPSSHSSVHRILRAMVKAGTWLPRNPGEPRYSHAIATLGFQAWDAAGRP